MVNFNYSAPAELFGSPGRQHRPVAYRRFSPGAEAVRFAVEGVSDALRPGVTLQADDDRFDHRAIRALYDSRDYPLTRAAGRPKETISNGGNRVLALAEHGELQWLSPRGFLENGSPLARQSKSRGTDGD